MLVGFWGISQAAAVPPVLVQREANRWSEAPAGVVVPIDSPTSTTFSLFIPAGFTAADAHETTLTLHFHGASWFMQQEHARRGARHPLLVANAKEGDAAYETDVMTPGVMEGVLSQTTARLAALTGAGDARIARLELSGFSAGYAGVRGVLRLPAFEPMVARVMLNDSLYVGDGPDSAPPDNRRPRRGADGIDPIVDFARKAMKGERELLMAFSSTPSFRSVGPMDCARAILAALELKPVEVEPDSMPAASVSADYQLAWMVDSGKAHFWCYRAAERPIHLAHVRNQADMWLALEGRRVSDLTPTMTIRDLSEPAQLPTTTALDLGTSGTIALFVPEGYKVPASGEVEVTLNFHGAGWFVIEEQQRRGNGGPVVALELGQGSTVYRKPFEDPAMFGRLLEAIAANLRERGAPAETRVTSVNITSISAGYGAVREIVKSDANVKLIRRIILCDSMYGGLDEALLPSGQRVVTDEYVEPWMNFAHEAILGRRTLLVLTSDISPSTYAGTHEVALAVTKALGVAVETVPLDSCPAAAAGLEYPLRARADAGYFHWWAYAGDGGKVHMTIARHQGDAWQALDQLGEW